MSRASVTYSLFLVILFVVAGGCNRSTSVSPTTSGERVKTLEARVARLEEDYRSAASTRDQARKQAAQLQEQKATLEQQLAQLNVDLEATRTALAQQQDVLRQRTSERDVLTTRCERMKKGLQTILGQDDTSTSTPGTGANGGL